MRNNTKLDWPSDRDMVVLRKVVEALEPTAELLTAMQSKSQSTSCQVYIGLRSLLQVVREIGRYLLFQRFSVHWNLQSHDDQQMSDICQDFIAAIEARFSYILDRANGNFDATYLLATFFDPRLSFALTDEESTSAQQYALRLVGRC